jgi:hypothetical protein
VGRRAQEVTLAGVAAASAPPSVLAADDGDVYVQGCMV